MTNPVTPVPPTPPAPPAGGGMPKWLIILLVILLVIIVGCCGLWGACYFFVRSAAQKMPAIIQEAERRQGISVNARGGEIPLPANFPSDIPVYSGFTPMLAITPPDAPDQGTVNFRGSGAADKIAAYYDTEMGNKGWKTESTNTNPIMRTYSKEGRLVTMSVNDDGSMINISYSKR